MNVLPYRTLAGPSHDEIVINKSRFIGYASPAVTEEQALDFLSEIRKKHRDATHNCYAYIIGQNAGIMRYSDDGEPGGTAGMPMIEVLKAKQLVNCCAVVTRYFGGILLGAGGLVRAYSKTCALGIEAAGIVTMEPSVSYLCEVPYSLWDRADHMLRDLPVQLSDKSFETAVSFTLIVRSNDAESVLAKLTELTEGQIVCLEDKTFFAAWKHAGA